MHEAKIIPLHPDVFEPCFISSFQEIEIPFFSCYISAGFPSPADDYLEDRINLNSYLIQNPTSTYMMRVKGNSMQDANIHEGDILVIDKSLKPNDGVPVVCFLDGEFTVKTFRKINNKLYLEPANPAYKPIEITDDMDMRVWGVVAWVLHKPVKL
ncbi:peptidase S24 [Adhaeribacter arboris]|uniref:Peptidase S24 n=1 Tax=Adhaeribacter arboris TaxID=2072846 RepID=A0A2T2YCM5_9BACT|nr:translesion error-prone DNA polymerase V autoproteolytic subunit [Adhaeribacter arboris]PSR53259.1 peptidase S24 [Adhaeribacter arboris]